MRNSFSSSDQFTIKMKNKTNDSSMEQYQGKELQRSLIGSGLKGVLRKQKINGKDEIIINDSSTSHHKLSEQASHNKVIQQDLPSFYPLSPNSKRIQNQLQLFNFDQKISQIQCHQIQQLINQQINAKKKKQLVQISQLLNKSLVHPQNSNAFRLYKNSVNRSSKGRYQGNKTTQSNGYEFFQPKSTGFDGIGESMQKRKENKSVIVHQGRQMQKQDNEKKEKGIIKPTGSLPIWKQNIFHEKILYRQNQNQTKQSMSKTYFSSTSTKGTFFNSQPKSAQQSAQKLFRIQQSLNVLKSKSFSIKKNYDYFINKLNSSNPQVHQELIDELNKSKMNQKLLLDHNNKSFSGYCKMKSYLYNSREGLKDKMIQQKQENKQEEDIYNNATNITSYKFNHLKPLKLRLYRKNKNQLLLFNKFEDQCPKLNRSKVKDDYSNSDQDFQSDQEIQSKFHQRYREKEDNQEVEKYIAQRKKISRQTASPYHELSAWN